MSKVKYGIRSISLIGLLHIPTVILFRLKIKTTDMEEGTAWNFLCCKWIIFYNRSSLSAYLETTLVKTIVKHLKLFYS